MIDYLLDFAIVLGVTGIFGLVLCGIGIMFEATGLAEYLAKKMEEIDDFEDED